MPQFERPHAVEQFLASLRMTNQGSSAEFDAFVDFMGVLDDAQQEAIVKYMMAKGVKTLSPQWIVFAIAGDLIRSVHHAASLAGEPISGAVNDLCAQADRIAQNSQSVRERVADLDSRVTSARALITALQTTTTSVESFIKAAAREEIESQERRWEETVASLRQTDSRNMKRSVGMIAALLAVVSFGALFLGFRMGIADGYNRAQFDGLYSAVHRQTLENMLQEAHRKHDGSAIRYITERLRR